MFFESVTASFEIAQLSRLCYLARFKLCVLWSLGLEGSTSAAVLFPKTKELISYLLAK